MNIYNRVDNDTLYVATITKSDKRLPVNVEIDSSTISIKNIELCYTTCRKSYKT